MTIDKAEDVKRNWPGDFVKYGRDPLSWAYQTETLKAAARVVLEQAEKDRINGIFPSRWVDPVYKYLAGVALENLLKAIMVRNDPCLVEDDRISDQLKKHDLWSRYADNRLQTVTAEDGTEQTLKVELEQDEQDFLKMIELYVMWIGRYPIATTEEIFMKNLDVVNSQLAEFSLDDFDATFDKIYDKLSKLALGVNLQKA